MNREEAALWDSAMERDRQMHPQDDLSRGIRYPEHYKDRYYPDRAGHYSNAISQPSGAKPPVDGEEKVEDGITYRWSGRNGMWLVAERPPETAERNSSVTVDPASIEDIQEAVWALAHTSDNLVKVMDMFNNNQRELFQIVKRERPSTGPL